MFRSLTLKTNVQLRAAAEEYFRSRNQLFTLLWLVLMIGAVFEVLPLRTGNAHANQGSLKLGHSAGHSTSQPAIKATRPRDAELITIPAGTVQIGDNTGPPSERPLFNYTSRPFLMDRTPVTVAQFAAFVKDTGYKTDAERYGSGGVLDEKQGGWVAIDGANWRLPRGPKGKPAETNHPVTQLSWYDADAFCRAYGSRLPTEFEWERAARIGQTPDGHVFKSGDSIERHGHYLINAWEGTFPLLNRGADGYRFTSPVGAFGTAPSGLTDMAGNVWEWTSSWYLPYGMPPHEPPNGERVARGGSFLCSATYCQGYRASARNHTTPDTSLENIGFRCVTDPTLLSSFAGRIVSHPSNPANRGSQSSATRGEAQ
jgi:sulfatase modifying factor 1